MIIAIDIGGTKIRVGYSHLGDYLEHTQDFPTPVSQRSVSQKLIDVVHEMVGSTKVDAIGIASPASINKERGLIVRARNMSWHNFRIVMPLQKHFGCPTVLEHDATAGGVAEARLGAGKNFPLVLYITISTGIGSSIIYNGKPISSRYNSQGGDQIVSDEFSGPTTFHDTSSGKAIELRYGHAASNIKDPLIWKLIAKDMAIGINNMIAIVQPDCVVLGGGVSVHYKRFIKPLKKELENLAIAYPIPVIKQARYVETAPAVGAMLLAVEALHK